MPRIFYTDGACSGNPGSGGFGVVEIGNKDSKDYIVSHYSQTCENTTNNREELKAILNVAEFIADYALTLEEVIIYSDSTYAVNLINTWMYTWAKNGWITSKKKPVENLDLVKRLYDIFNTPFFNVSVKKVPGHRGILGNELADKLARNDYPSFFALANKHNLFPDFEAIKVKNPF